MALKGGLCSEGYPRFNLDFIELATALQAAEGRKDLGVEVRRHEDLAVSDAVSHARQKVT